MTFNYHSYSIPAGTSTLSTRPNAPSRTQSFNRSSSLFERHQQQLHHYRDQFNSYPSTQHIGNEEGIGISSSTTARSSSSVAVGVRRHENSNTLVSSIERGGSQNLSQDDTVTSPSNQRRESPDRLHRRREHLLRQKCTTEGDRDSSTENQNFHDETNNPSYHVSIGDESDSDKNENTSILSSSTRTTPINSILDHTEPHDAVKSIKSYIDQQFSDEKIEFYLNEFDEYTRTKNSQIDNIDELGEISTC